MGEGEPADPIAFDGVVVEWRGPAPFYFVRLPAARAGELRAMAARVSYGWGCLQVAATIGAVAFDTSLIPKDGGYLLPLKRVVRQAVGAAPGEQVHAVVQLAARRPGRD